MQITPFTCRISGKVSFEKETNMKRFLICLVTLALLLCASVSVVSAAPEYEEDVSIWENIQLNTLYLQSGDGIYSDLAEDYFELWWAEDEGVDEMYFYPCTINMRGFAMAANGDYAYMGNLNGGDGLRGVVVFNTVTGVCTDLFYHQNVDENGMTTGFSYAKGIDADNRGYVYVGFTYFPDNGVVHLSIAEQQNDGTLTEVADIPVYEDPNGAPGVGAHLGINGVDVVTIDEKTYCYVVVNYDYDALYCFDVTDPANPVLNTEFGTGGFINFTGANVEGNTVSELQYLDVDEDGSIWVVAETNNGTGVIGISADGSETTSYYGNIGEGEKIYSITSVGDFLLLGAKASSNIFVADKSTGEQVAKFTCYGADGYSYGDRVTRMVIRNDVLYVCNASNETSDQNGIYVAALSDDGLTYIQNVMKSLNGEFDTEAPTDDTKEPAADDTVGVDTNPETPAESEDVTEADTTADTNAGDETNADTSAETPASTAKSDDEGGCASALISCGSVMALLAAAFVVSKKK